MYDYKETIAKKMKFSDSKLLEEFTLYLIYNMKQRKMTQDSYAAELGVDTKTISRWVTGKNKCSVVNFFNIICEIGVEGFNKYLEDKYQEKK